MEIAGLATLAQRRVPRLFCARDTERFVNGRIKPTVLSFLEDGRDSFYLIADGSTQPIARLVNPGAVFVADVGELGLLPVGQVQIFEVRDPTGHPVAHL